MHSSHAGCPPVPGIGPLATGGPPIQAPRVPEREPSAIVPRSTAQAENRHRRSKLSFGKHSEKTLPQVLFRDPDWFFWAWEEGVFENRPEVYAEAECAFRPS